MATASGGAGGGSHAPDEWRELCESVAPVVARERHAWQLLRDAQRRHGSEEDDRRHSERSRAANAAALSRECEEAEAAYEAARQQRLRRLRTERFARNHRRREAAGRALFPHGQTLRERRHGLTERLAQAETRRGDHERRFLRGAAWIA